MRAVSAELSRWVTELIEAGGGTAVPRLSPTSDEKVRELLGRAARSAASASDDAVRTGRGA